MLKSFKAWLQAREEAESQEQFERGYSYACTEMLLHNRDPIEGTIDRDHFDRGVDKAIIDVSLLKQAYSSVKAGEWLALFDEPTETEPDPLDGVDIPVWARWIAQDEDRSVYAYENEPRISEDAWVLGDNDGRFTLIPQYMGDPNWRQTKRKL